MKKYMFFDGFLIFLNLCSILVHQTTKFDFSGSFYFSWHPWHPWHPWGHKSSVVICSFRIISAVLGMVAKSIYSHMTSDIFGGPFTTYLFR
jgi:hypothetical protein